MNMPKNVKKSGMRDNNESELSDAMNMTKRNNALMTENRPIFVYPIRRMINDSLLWEEM